LWGLIRLEVGKCKRMKVVAFGVNDMNETALKTNVSHTEEGCTNEVGNCGCSHAEEELLKVLNNVQVAVISLSPCINCARLLVVHGVKTVLYIEEYRRTDGIDYLKKQGVVVGKLSENMFF